MAVLPVSVALVTGLTLLSAIPGAISVPIYDLFQGETRHEDGSPRPQLPAGQHLQIPRRRLHAGTKAQRVRPTRVLATQTTTHPGPQDFRSESRRPGGLVDTLPTSLSRALRVLRQRRTVQFRSGSESLRHSLQRQALDYMGQLSVVHHDLVQQMFGEVDPHHHDLGNDRHLPNPHRENQGNEKHHLNPNNNNNNNNIQGNIDKQQQHPEQNPDLHLPSNTKQEVVADDWNLALGLQLMMNLSTGSLHDVVLKLKNVWSIVGASKQLLRETSTDGDEADKMHCLKQTLAQMTPAEQQRLLRVLDDMWQDIVDKSDKPKGSGSGSSSPQKVDIADVCCMVG